MKFVKYQFLKFGGALTAPCARRSWPTKSTVSWTLRTGFERHYGEGKMWKIMRQFGALERNVCLIKVTMLYNIVSNDICQALDLIFTNTARARRSLDSSCLRVLVQLFPCILTCHIRIHWSSSGLSSAGTWFESVPNTSIPKPCNFPPHNDGSCG